MASGEEQKKEGAGQGFAGLSSMVSDVDVTVEPPEQKAQSKPDTATNNPQPRATSSQEGGVAKSAPQTYQAPVQPSGGTSGGKWLLGIGAVIGVIWLVGASGNKNTSSPSSYTSSSYATAPTSQPPVSEPQAPRRPTEEMPPVGRDHVLGAAQIRYCLAEDIRMEAAKGSLNNYSDSDVDRFNAMVADYNSRCGAFRYRSGSLELARSDISPFISDLRAEGVLRFSARNNPNSNSISKSAANEPASKYLNTESLAEEEKNKLLVILSSDASNCLGDVACEFGRFSLLPVDIDLDGKTEYLVTHGDYCGSGGCSTFLFKKDASGWRQIASAFGWVSLANTQQNGYRNLVIESKVYRPAGGWDMSSKEYFWAGDGYRSN